MHLADLLTSALSSFSSISGLVSPSALLTDGASNLPSFQFDLLGASWSGWQNKLFQKPLWTGLMMALRLTLTLGGILLLIAEVRARRLGVPIRERSKKRIALLFTILSFGAYFDFGNPNVRYSEYYHRHELYHYYLGAKYFPELGYTYLYDCTMVAEIDNGRKSQIVDREFRDLRVNLIKQAKDTFVLSDPDQCRTRFAKDRWEDFRKDVDWFYNSSRGSYWERMQQDHGYNPPPLWTTQGKIIASLHPASDGFFKFLASIDVVLQLGMVLMLHWAFGWRVGAIATIFWGCNAAANFYWTGGAFLRQDWMFGLVASVCLSRKGKHFWAGAALMWSALLRVFPAILFFGWGVMILSYVVQRLRGKEPSKPGESGLLSYLHPTHRKLIAGAVVALSILGPWSAVSTGGLQTYKDFVHHIGTHKKTPLTNHMGLPTVVSHNWEGRMRFTRNENLDDAFKEWKDGRNERKESMRLVRYGVFGAFCLWIAWALHRSRLLWLGPPLSLILVFCLTDLTCYYYSMFIIAGVIAKVRRQTGIALLATAASSILLLGRDIGYAPTNLSGFYFVDDNFAAQSYVFLVGCILTLWLMSRPFSRDALRSFWNRTPPPKPETYRAGEQPVSIGGL